MARAYCTDVLLDSAGNAIANARGLLYTNAAATTPATDAYAASAGGTPITYVDTDTSGAWGVYFDTPKSFWIQWTDNGDTAYPVNEPSERLTWTPFVSKEKQAFQKPADDLIEGLLTGTFAARPAAGTAGRKYIATWASGSIRREYYDTGSAWVCVSDPPGVFNPLDYGADPTHTTDSRTAFVNCVTAALAYHFTTTPGSDFDYVGAVIEVTSGAYWCSSGIVLSDLVTNTYGRSLTFRGRSGKAGEFNTGGQALINFATTNNSFGNVVGFTAHAVPTLGSAIVVKFESLQVWGAPAWDANDDGSSGAMGREVSRDCVFRSFVSGTAPVRLDNVFWQYFDYCSFRAPDTSTANVLMTAGVVNSNVLAWDMYFTKCVLSSGLGIRLDVGSASVTLPGLNVVLDGTTSENQAAGGALLNVRNTHASASVTVSGVTVRNGFQYDATGACALVKLETLGTGALNVNGVRVVGGDIATGASYHLLTAAASTGQVNPDFVLLDTPRAPLVSWGAPIGSGYGAMGFNSGSGWSYKAASTATNARVRTVAVNGETSDRLREFANGWMFRSAAGAATPDVVFAIGAGSPEGVVTSNVGGIYQRTDGASGAAAYVKASGTGNTGWAALPDATAALLASANVFTTTQHIRPTSSGAKALQARASTTSPGNIIEAQDSSGVVLTSIGATGALTVTGGVTVSTGGITLTTGGLVMSDGNNEAYGTTNGTKHGTATSQKQSFWNATPVVQPTTGVAAATLVGGGGTTLTDTDTFDGYTLKQVVKALRTIGLLA